MIKNPPCERVHYVKKYSPCFFIKKPTLSIYYTYLKDKIISDIVRRVSQRYFLLKILAYSEIFKKKAI